MPTSPPNHEMKTITAAELRCPCCHVQMAVPRLLEDLNAIQTALQKEITIDSGYRCAAHNAAVGGAPQSYHTSGMAADISAPPKAPLEMYLIAEQIPDFAQGGIGLYPANFIHVDVRSNRARWYRVDGKNHPITDYITHAHAT